METLIALKFDFIKIICGYEHYIQLNFPLRNSVDNPFEKLENLQKDFWLGLLISLRTFVVVTS